MNPSTMLERAQDLIIARATIGLSAAEGEELRELVETLDPKEAASLEAAVNATRAAMLGESEEDALPAGLRERLIATGTPEPEIAGRIARNAGIGSGERRRQATWIPWSLAAAAILLAGATVIALKPWGRTARFDAAAIEARADTVRWAFKPNDPAYAGATGEVVWNEGLQRGFMRLKGVAVNDPKLRQYQLWIVDPARDTHPVDGGVFDVASTGEVIVPFEARLGVRGPAAFAITSEKPGGVVVSGGPLLIVAAKPG